MDKRYDRAYFDKWYRSDAHRVGSRAQLARKVAMVVHLAEYYLARPLRNVLDVGCGEAAWRAPLLQPRPKLAYRGLDASEYVVARYGRSRNIGLATFGQLAELRFDERYDLVVCSDMLHYVPAREVARGLSGFVDLLEGFAFIEVFTARDDPVIPVDAFEKLQLPPNVELDIADFGGHCGFIRGYGMTSFTDDYIAARFDAIADRHGVA